MVSVDLSKCTGCRVCEAVCPAGVFSVLCDKACVGNEADCVLCKNCETSCPMRCIKIDEKGV